MKDFLGRELNVGDFVVFTQPNYRNFVRAKVVKLTKQKVRIIYSLHPDKKTLDVDGYTMPHITDPDFLVKIEDSND